MHSLLNDRLAHLFKDIFATKPQGNTTTDHLQGPKGRVVGGGWVTAGIFVKLEFCKRRIFGVKNGPLSEDDRKTWSNKRAHIWWCCVCYSTCDSHFWDPEEKRKTSFNPLGQLFVLFCSSSKRQTLRFLLQPFGETKGTTRVWLKFHPVFLQKSPDLFVTKMRFRIWMFCTATARSVRELKGLQALLKAIHLMPITPQRYTFGSVQVDITLHTKRLRPIYFFLGGTWGCFMGFSSQLTMIPINDH